MGNQRAFYTHNPEISLSAGHERMIVFARRRSGGLAHVDAVANGKACDCVCLACNEALIARQGEVLAHSFAHQSGTECEHALEAMLHGLAAEVIGLAGHLVVPELDVLACVFANDRRLQAHRHRPAIKVPVDSVCVQQLAPWPRPCVVVRVKGKALVVHLAVKHLSTPQKRQALAELSQAAIEVDLGKAFPGTVGALEQILLQADPRKVWLFNPREAELRAELDAELAKQVANQLSELEARRRSDEALAAQKAAEQAARSAQAQALWEEQRLQRRWEMPELPELPAPRPVVHRSQKPAELSPSVEYTSSEGRLWLLHSAQPDLRFKIEPGATQALNILQRHGAMPEANGTYVIKPEGWSGAMIELARHWHSILSVSSNLVGL